MKLMTLKKFEKKSKEALIRFITKQLRKKSRKALANVAYHMTKAKLPRLKMIKQKALPKHKTTKRITRRLSKDEKKRRQEKLKGINNWRKSQGMKKIVIK